jgi:histone chaperone ASF1
MSLVNVTNVIVHDNPTAFTNDFQFEIQFECLQELSDPEDLDWKVVYVGASDDETKDQVLTDIAVGPVQQGVSSFVLVAPPPDHRMIDSKDLIGVTVILITGSYNEHEFMRIGYYVNNDYDPPTDPDNPPTQVNINELRRHILAEEPRVTRVQIPPWTSQRNQMNEELHHNNNNNTEVSSTSNSDGGRSSIPPNIFALSGDADAIATAEMYDEAVKEMQEGENQRNNGDDNNNDDDISLGDEEDDEDDEDDEDNDDDISLGDED